MPSDPGEEQKSLAYEQRPIKSRSWFDRMAKSTSRMAGRPTTFLIAVGVIILWLLSGFVFGFNDTWQLVINTATTIITFLMVFLIQSTQNRDTGAMQVKLDELIRAVKGAHNALLDLEELSEQDLAKIRSGYEDLAAKAREAVRQGKTDDDCPEIVAGR